MKNQPPADVAREALGELMRQHEKNDAALAHLQEISGEIGRPGLRDLKAAVLMKAIVPRGFRRELRLLDPIEDALAIVATTDPIPAELIRLRYIEGHTWPEVEEILQIWPEERAQLEEQGMDRLGRILMITN